MSLTKIAVLVSGSGSNLQALIDCIHGKYGEIKLVISNKHDAYGIQRAKNSGIATEVIETTGEASDHEIIKLMKENNLKSEHLAGLLARRAQGRRLCGNQNPGHAEQKIVDSERALGKLPGEHVHLRH